GFPDAKRPATSMYPKQSKIAIESAATRNACTDRAILLRSGFISVGIPQAEVELPAPRAQVGLERGSRAPDLPAVVEADGAHRRPDPDAHPSTVPHVVIPRSASEAEDSYQFDVLGTLPDVAPVEKGGRRDDPDEGKPEFHRAEHQDLPASGLDMGPLGVDDFPAAELVLEVASDRRGTARAVTIVDRDLVELARGAEGGVRRRSRAPRLDKATPHPHRQDRAGLKRDVSGRLQAQVGESPGPRLSPRHKLHLSDQIVSAF